MKSFLTKLFSAVLALGMLAGCETEQEKLILNDQAVPVATLSGNNLVLTRERADQNALTISWAQPDYGFSAAARYSILFDKKGGDFSKAQTIDVGSELTKTLTVSELNSLLIALGLTPGAAADVDVRVRSTLGPTTNLSSVIQSLKVTPYLDRLDLSTNWGVVGSATANGWDGPDQPFYKSTSNPNELVAYVTLTAGEIKFRQDNKWDVNLGGSNGTLSPGGDNIKVTAGTYRITFNPTASTYKIEPYTWGLVGDATANGWNGPDQMLSYDPATDQWFAVVTLKAGELKFRLNNDWGTNFGGSAGRLVAGGDNIKVTAGTYLVVADFKQANLKYTLTPAKAWGLVGSATPNGWNGPDLAFRPDLVTNGIWTLSNVTLKAGEVKVRVGNQWTENYGGTSQTGPLTAGGDNIVVAAGRYDITLDVTNPNAPRITMTRK